MEDTWNRLSWAVQFAAASVAGIVVIGVAVWLMTGIGALDLDPVAQVAVVIGLTATVALAVGLMGMMFYSQRSGHDDLQDDEIIVPDEQRRHEQRRHEHRPAA